MRAPRRWRLKCEDESVNRREIDLNRASRVIARVSLSRSRKWGPSFVRGRARACVHARKDKKPTREKERLTTRPKTPISGGGWVARTTTISHHITIIIINSYNQIGDNHDNINNNCYHKRRQWKEIWIEICWCERERERNIDPYICWEIYLSCGQLKHQLVLDLNVKWW